ncbi:hypothetical protein [Corynebacterium deserti]|uniref:hypothetical protein n=1 Tax=Corynebacterium deserti TaxID=1408191 RepID=UPI000A4BCA88|nr:hypothetical protein [Corynebacterium deserti]
MIPTMLKNTKSTLLKVCRWNGWNDREKYLITIIIRNLDELVQIYEVRTGEGKKDG